MSIALRGFLAMALVAAPSFAIACPLCDRGFDESRVDDEGLSPRKRKLQFFSNEQIVNFGSTAPIKGKKQGAPLIKSLKKKAKPTHKVNDADVK